MRGGVALAALAAIAASAPAHAEEPRGRTTATAAAIVPGVVVHGAGHWVAGDRPVARRLLVLEGIALGATLVGGLAIGLTGGAEETMPTIALLVPGGGALVVGWLADIYGAAGGARIGGRPEVAPPPVELEVGWTYVRDAHFTIDHLATAGAEVRAARWRGGAAAWIGDRAWQVHATTAARILGGTPGRAAVDGTSLDLAAAVTEERRAGDGFDTSAVELAVIGRYDLGRIGGSLAGSYASGELGFGGERTRYAADPMAPDTHSTFVGRFAFGVYLGDGAGRRAEAELFYDHRRDGLAGGLLLPFGANGFIGHLGAQGVAYRGPWGMSAGVEVGSAWVARLGVRYRWGAR